jgi:hypothetical protein
MTPSNQLNLTSVRHLNRGLFSDYFLDEIVPTLTGTQESHLAAEAEAITTLAQERYQLHSATRHRISSDLGKGGKLNEALTDWWGLADFNSFREQTKKAFKTDVPLKERGEWESFLAAQRLAHQHLTQTIISHEQRLNAVVYAAFALTPEEIVLIERSTQYPYGAT